VQKRKLMVDTTTLGKH